MTDQHKARRNQAAGKKTSKNRWLALAASLAVAVALIGGVAWLFTGDGDADNPPDGASAAVPLPIGSGPQTVLGLRVDEPAVDRGRLPLDTTVTQVFDIVNTGTGPAEFGKATIEVLDGCCPPQVRMTQMVVAVGQTAGVGFSTQMHEGMDGPHLFHLTVPFRTAEGDDALHLYFKGDFRG
jgi:hypothetical protein